MADERKRWAEGDPRNDRIYLGILLSLMATVFAAALLAIAGDLVWNSPALRDGGFYVALVAGAAYFAFRIWGRVRAAQMQRDRLRRQLAEDPPADDDHEDGAGPGGRAL